MKSEFVDVYVSVGSNINPEKELHHGVALMRDVFGELEVSSVYCSPSFGFTGDDFLNLVARFTTSLDAPSVEEHLDSIERSGNRSSSGRFAPRALDCDMLLYGSCVRAEARLPRDDVVRYPFVLGPLAEIAPELPHPLDGATIESHWIPRRAAAQLTRICRVDDLALPADAATAVDGENLSGHIGRITSEI